MQVRFQSRLLSIKKWSLFSARTIFIPWANKDRYWPRSGGLSNFTMLLLTIDDSFSNSSSVRHFKIWWFFLRCKTSRCIWRPLLGLVQWFCAIRIWLIRVLMAIRIVLQRCRDNSSSHPPHLARNNQRQQRFTCRWFACNHGWWIPNNSSPQVDLASTHFY